MIPSPQSNNCFSFVCLFHSQTFRWAPPGGARSRRDTCKGFGQTRDGWWDPQPWRPHNPMELTRGKGGGCFYRVAEKQTPPHVPSGVLKKKNLFRLGLRQRTRGWWTNKSQRRSNLSRSRLAVSLMGTIPPFQAGLGAIGSKLTGRAKREPG